MSVFVFYQHICTSLDMPVEGFILKKECSTFPMEANEIDKGHISRMPSHQSHDSVILQIEVLLSYARKCLWAEKGSLCSIVPDNP